MWVNQLHKLERHCEAAGGKIPLYSLSQLQSGLGNHFSVSSRVDLHM